MSGGGQRREIVLGNTPMGNTACFGPSSLFSNIEMKQLGEVIRHFEVLISNWHIAILSNLEMVW